MRRGGFTNLSSVVLNDDTEDSLDVDDFEVDEADSVATSLVRRRAVRVDLVVSKALAAEKNRKNNAPAFAIWWEVKEAQVFIVVSSRLLD